MSSHEDSAGEFCCVGSIFSMKLLGFVSKAVKLLLTELVTEMVGQYGKGCGQYISALTSHLVTQLYNETPIAHGGLKIRVISEQV